MGDIYYQGIWRMDWGLGNPNKTAALIALLMLAVWALPLLRRWLFWVALAAFAVLGACLVHTMSRGGVVAAVAGLAVLLARLRLVWPWSWCRVLAVVVAVGLMLAGKGVLQTSTRFARSHQDRSVANRLVIWQQAPRMMVDAPWGWGLGNSGTAYMSWYQPLENTESYRTLVNSHLTWLVEWSWFGRLLYLAGWSAVFALCSGSGLTVKPAFFSGVVGGMWTAFFVAAFFSSVAETPWLWVLPLLGLTGVLAMRIKLRLWPSRRVWIGVVATALVVLGVLVVWGYSTAPPADAERLTVHGGGAVCVGTREPRSWVVIGKNSTTVSDTYPRVYREDKVLHQVGFVSEFKALPPDLSDCKLTVFGALDDWSLLSATTKTCKSVLLVAPNVLPDELELPPDVRVQVVFGEFSEQMSAVAWHGSELMKTLEGVGDFICDWPKLVWEAHE